MALPKLFNEVLDSWREWNVPPDGRPVLVEELHGGKTNRSFLVADETQRYVVRINSPYSDELGICRIREAIILDLVGCSFAPRVCYHSGQFMVCQFVKGRQWEAEDFSKPEQVEKLERLLDRIQAIDVPENLQKFSYRRHCEHYIQQLAEFCEVQGSSLTSELLNAATLLDNDPEPAVICHHDLVPENIIETSHGLVLLDWEYAAPGHRLMDRLVISKNQGSGCELAARTVSSGMDELWRLNQKRLQTF